MARKPLLVTLVLLTGACTADPAGPPPSSYSTLTAPTLINESGPPQNVITMVRDVIDGRTIEFADGTKVRVALLAAPSACWAESSLMFARTTLLASTVRFTGVGPGEVNLELEDGTDYATLAVQRGVLRPEGVDGGPLISAQSEAAAAKRGLWGPPCEGSGTSSSGSPSTTAALTSASPPAPAPAPPPPPPPPAATTTKPPTVEKKACAVAYRITGQWQGGFQAKVTVRNTDTKPTFGWTLRWTFANGESVRDMWNATPRQSGPTVSAVNAGYNPQIAPGASVEVGFNGNSFGANSAPGAFTLNGAQCSVE